jgi:hypothetical protein
MHSPKSITELLAPFGCPNKQLLPIYRFAGRATRKGAHNNSGSYACICLRKKQLPFATWQKASERFLRPFSGLGFYQ